MHTLLARQLKRTRLALEAQSPELAQFLALVDQAYQESDRQRQMVERSLTIMSEELQQRNQTLLGQLEAFAKQARVLENIHDVAIVIDESGAIVSCFTVTERHFGLAREAMVGRALAEFARSPVLSVTMEQRIAECCASGRSEFDLEYGWNTPAPKMLAARLIALPEATNAPRCFLLVGHDATSKRRMDEQASRSQKLEAIGELAAGVAHEINTPAQYVCDNLRFLGETLPRLLAAAKGQLPADDLEFLATELPAAIQQSIEGMQRVAEIVHGIKMFSHPGGGDRTLVDVNQEIEMAVLVSRNEWKYVAEVETQLDPDLPRLPSAAGDMGHIFLNLIVNASHAIADHAVAGRKGHIRLSTARRGECIEIVVQDDGPGIPAEIRGRIFDPFFTTKPVGKGTGQGLAIAHQVVVEKYGGSIDVDSSPGQGARFIVRFPVDSKQEPGIRDAA